jgi:hypothetical protein
MIDTSALIRGANVNINIFTKRLVEDIAWDRDIPQDGCRGLHVALHLRMVVLFSLLELTTIEKAIFATKHAFAKRYHYKNLVANTSECYKLLYHFGTARKKSIWANVYEIVKNADIPDLLIQYQEITKQLDDFGNHKIDKQLRDITMHYSENMLTVYELTVAFNNENDAHQYYIGFNDILRSMLDFSNELLDVYTAQTSFDGTITISSNLVGDAKVSSIRNIIDTNKTLLSTIDKVLPKGTHELDYFAQTEVRLAKIHDFAKQNLPIQNDELLSEMAMVVRMADLHVLLRFMMLDMMSNLEALFYANSTLEAALHIRRFVIPQVSMMILLFGYTPEEQEHSLWHQIEPKIPLNLVDQGNMVKKILTELLSRIPKSKRNSHVHVYDDKGSNLVPTFVGAMEYLNFQEELGMVLKISQFYGLFMSFMAILMTELAEIAHKNNEQSARELNKMIETALQRVEAMKLPENIKQQLLEQINRIKETAQMY